jgi:hypothetical protein
MESDDLQLTSAPQVLPSPTGQQTAKRAVEILLASGQGFAQPTAKQREALLIAFVQEGFVIYGKAFDIVKVAGEVDLTSVEDIRRRLDSITLYEVKSTGKAAVDSDFRRYFFSLSTAELLVAQNLGSRYRFAFVNTLTGAHLELTLREVFARARGIYPTWSIQF